MSTFCQSDNPLLGYNRLDSSGTAYAVLTPHMNETRLIEDWKPSSDALICGVYYTNSGSGDYMRRHGSQASGLISLISEGWGLLRV